MQSVENNHKENLQGSDFMSNFALANVEPCIPRGVAQPGSAPGLGPGGRRFESCRPDIFHIQST